MKTNPSSISDQLKQDIEDCAVQIQRCRAIGAAMEENTDALRRLLQELDERIVSMHAKLPTDRTITTQLGRLRQRIQRLVELRNIQELGSFRIEIDKAMAEAWRALP